MKKYLKNTKWEVLNALNSNLHKLFLNNEYVAAYQQDEEKGNLYHLIIFQNNEKNILKSFICNSNNVEDIHNEAEKTYAFYIKEKFEKINEQYLKLKKKMNHTYLENICCGKCFYHQYEDIDDGYVCVNGDSEYVAEWTENDFYCEEYEPEIGE